MHSRHGTLVTALSVHICAKLLLQFFREPRFSTCIDYVGPLSLKTGMFGTYTAISLTAGLSCLFIFYFEVGVSCWDTTPRSFTHVYPHSIRSGPRGAKVGL
jgi:hypothetical protein